MTMNAPLKTSGRNCEERTHYPTRRQSPTSGISSTVSSRRRQRLGLTCEQVSNYHWRLETYDDEVPEKEKTTKLICISTDVGNDFDFDRLVNLVSEELSRRKSGNTTLVYMPVAANAKKNFAGGIVNRRRSGRTLCSDIHHDDSCLVCGKQSHYAKDCYHRTQSGSGNRGGRGRERPVIPSRGFGRGSRNHRSLKSHDYRAV